MSTSTETTHCYHFQVLRYVPNLVSGEYFNIGLLLYDSEKRLIDAPLRGRLSAAALPSYGGAGLLGGAKK